MYVTLLILSVVLFAATLAVYLRQPAASLFHPATFYLLFHGLVFVLRPIVAWINDYDALYAIMRFEPTEWEKTQVLICTNLGLIVFMGVIMAAARTPLIFRQDAHDLAERRALLQRFWFVAAPLALLGLWAVFFVWEIRSEGVLLSSMDRRTGGGALNVSNGYFISTIGVLPTIAAIIAYLGRFRAWSLVPFGLFMVLGFGSGLRGDVIAGAVMIGVLYVYDRRKLWPGWTLVLAAVPLLLVFDAVRADRGGAVRELFGVEDAGALYAPEDQAALESMDFANMEYFEYLVWAVPKRTGTYDYFLNNLQLFTEPIPRALWPDKPVGAPIKRFELYRFSTPLGITFSVPGMGWYNLGYAGVAIWCALFALIYAQGYRVFARGGQSTLAVLAYAVFLATSLVAFRDGSVLTILKQMLFYFLPVVLLWLAARATQVGGFVPVRIVQPSAAGSGGAARRRAMAAGGMDGAPPLPTREGRGRSTLSARERRQARMNAGL